MANAGARQDAAAPPSEAEQRAQQASQFGPDIKYDVVSIRADKPVPEIPVPSSWAGPLTIQSPFLPDGLAFRNATVRLMFNYFAYPGIPSYLIFGEPGWWTYERYDVLAKTDGAVAEKLQKLAPDQQRLAREWMLQELLADQFKLKVHWETRPLPRYVITIASAGSKLKEAAPNEVFRGQRAPDTGWILFEANGQETGVNVTTNYFVRRFAPLLGRPVVDETGLTGHYDFKLQWDPGQIEAHSGGTSVPASSADAASGPAFAAPTPPGPGLRKAIQQQLGLELRESVGPVRVLVIDHVEKPTTESSDTNAIASQDANASQTERAPQTPNAGPSPDRDAQNESPATTAAPQFGPEFKFAVASIKPGDANENYGGYGTSSLPDGMGVKNMPLRELLKMAYGISNDKRLIGVPESAKSERYTIEAKMDASVADALKKLKPEQRTLARQQMLQELLAERFGLKVHSETRQMPVYELLVAQGGTKLAPTAAPPEPLPGSPPTPPSPELAGRIIGTPRVSVPLGRRGYGTSSGLIVMSGGSTERLARMLSGNLGREVVDKTGISGDYDLVLQWDPSPGEAEYAGNVSGPSAGIGDQPAFSASTPSRFPGVQKAIEQQLGLELRDATGPVRVIVIDHIEKPTEN